MQMPDQIAMRLAALRTEPHETACFDLIGLLEDVLPELVVGAVRHQQQEPSADFSETIAAMIEELHEVRQRHRGLILDAGVTERNRAALALRERGYSTDKIADAVQITHGHLNLLLRRAKGAA